MLTFTPSTKSPRSPIHPGSSVYHEAGLMSNTRSPAGPPYGPGCSVQPTLEHNGDPLRKRPITSQLGLEFITEVSLPHRTTSTSTYAPCLARGAENEENNTHKLCWKQRVSKVRATHHHPWRQRSLRGHGGGLNETQGSWQINHTWFLRKEHRSSASFPAGCVHVHRLWAL